MCYICDEYSNKVIVLAKARNHRLQIGGSGEQYDYDANSGYLYRIQFNGTTVWQLSSVDDYGRIIQATIGTTGCTWNYDSNNNMLSQIYATGVQRQNYSFDVNTGNLNWRTDSLKHLTENFGYDSATDKLDRLKSVAGPEDMTVNYTTNKNGNILSKSDAGTFAYENTPYAVSSVSNFVNIDTARQQIEYYSFGKVKKITESGKTAEFVYNSDRQRIRMVLKNNGTVSKTKWYFGSSFEREQVGSTVTQYAWIGGDPYTAVAVAKKTGSGSWVIYNIFRDHLGTITHLKTGSTITQYSYDAWGRRRDKDTWGYTLSGEPALFAGRGFTAHEHLEDFSLVNMNGRIYDPVVGRFLRVDPLASKYPSISGYAAMNNNPIFFVDPDGRENLPALQWARKNMSNKGITSNYGNPWFGGSDNRWTYKSGSVPTRAVCYESCFMSYMNSGDPIVSHLKETGFSNKYNAFKGRSTETGGINWFKSGDGTDRSFVTDISKGELGDMVFMGEVGDMEGHAVLLNESPTLGSYDDKDGNTIETMTINALSTSSDSDQGNFGERTFTFDKQSDGSWKQQGGAGYTFRGYGQLNADFFKKDEENTGGN